MHKPSDTVTAVLDNHQVLSMALSLDDIPWAANAFYVYDDQSVRLLFLTSADTRHGEMLGLNARVAGTIAAQFEQIVQIHGLQFYGTARCLVEPRQAALAYERYYQRFPQARGITAPIWEIHLMHLKLTDNRLGFGHKTQWFRDVGQTQRPAHCTAPDTTTTTAP